MKNDFNTNLEHSSTLEDLKRAFYENRSHFVSTFLEDEDDFDDETDNF